MAQMYKLLVTGVFVVVSATQAAAVSEGVKRACYDDYMAYCPQHEVGSDSLRSCMRGARKQLSKQCTTELARSGEASKADIERYKRDVR